MERHSLLLEKNKTIQRQAKTRREPTGEKILQVMKKQSRKKTPPHHLFDKTDFYGDISTTVWTSWWIRKNELEVLAILIECPLSKYDQETNTLTADRINIATVPFCFDKSTAFDKFVLSSYGGMTDILDYTKRLDRLIYKDVDKEITIESWKDEIL
jgi:hypothetical protein